MVNTVKRTARGKVPTGLKNTGNKVVKKTGHGARIRAARERLGLTQPQALEKAGWGKSDATRWSNYELEKRDPNLTDMLTVAAVLNEDPAMLWFGVTQADPNLKKIIEAYHNATQQGRDYLLDTADIVNRRHRR